MNGPRYAEMIKDKLILHMTVEQVEIVTHGSAPCLDQR